MILSKPVVAVSGCGDKWDNIVWRAFLLIDSSTGGNSKSIKDFGITCGFFNFYVFSNGEVGGTKCAGSFFCSSLRMVPSPHSLKRLLEAPIYALF